MSHPLQASAEPNGNPAFCTGIAHHPGIKFCRTCGVLKVVDDFHFHAQTKDRRNTLCKDCAKQKTKRWAAEHPDRDKARRASYYQQNKATWNKPRTAANIVQWSIYKQLLRLSDVDGNYSRTLLISKFPHLRDAEIPEALLSATQALTTAQRAIRRRK